MKVDARACGSWRTTCRNWFSPSTMCVPGIELRSSGLVASTCLHWTISLAPRVLRGSLCRRWTAFPWPLLGIRLWVSIQVSQFNKILVSLKQEMGYHSVDLECPQSPICWRLVTQLHAFGRPWHLQETQEARRSWSIWSSLEGNSLIYHMSLSWSATLSQAKKAMNPNQPWPDTSKSVNQKWSFSPFYIFINFLEFSYNVFLAYSPSTPPLNSQVCPTFPHSIMLCRHYFNYYSITRQVRFLLLIYILLGVGWGPTTGVGSACQDPYP